MDEYMMWWNDEEVNDIGLLAGLIGPIWMFKQYNMFYPLEMYRSHAYQSLHYYT